MKLGIVAISIILIIFFFYKNPNNTKEIDYIKISDINENDEVFYGIVKSTQSSILSFQAEGKIVFFPYTKGDFVKKNQVIARLDGALYSIRKNEEEAKLKEYFIQKQKQEKYYKRLDVLHKEGAISDNDWESAYYELKSLNKQIEIQKEKINYLDKEISYNVILAPFDGYISQKFSDLNSFAKTGMPIVEIITKKATQVEVMVGENFINKLEISQKAKLKINNENYWGKISHISKSSLGSGGFLIKIDIINPNSNIKEGMNSEVYFTKDEKQTINLPIHCILEKNNENYVLKIKKIDENNGKINISKIKIREISNNSAEIIEGIEKNELVICERKNKYKENQRIKL